MISVPELRQNVATQVFASLEVLVEQFWQMYSLTDHILDVWNIDLKNNVV